MKTLLTAPQTADYLKVKLSTVRKWTHLKFIPVIKIRGVARYDRDELDLWLTKLATKGRTRIRMSPFEENDGYPPVAR